MTEMQEWVEEVLSGFSFDMLDPVEVLTRAREIVAKGWCQDYMVLTAEGDYTSKDLFKHEPGKDSFCMLGACRYAMYDCAPQDVKDAIIEGPGERITYESDFEDAEELITRALWTAVRQLHDDYADRKYRAIPAYNDYTYRTREEVLAVFDKAIAMMTDDIYEGCTTDGCEHRA